MCGTPPSKIFPKTSTQPHTLFFGVFWDFRSKKGKINRPTPKMVKNGQNCPAIGEIIRGVPRKSQQILKISEKWPKTPTVQSENAPKRVKMAKNDQKSATRDNTYSRLARGGIFGRRHPLLCSFFRQSRVKGSK